MTRALRMSVFVLIAAAAWMLAPTPAEALLAKHNCSFCHSLHGGPTPGGSSSFVPENSPTNIEVLCLGCHFNAIDGSQPPYNSDTDGIPATAVQSHRSDGSHAEFHVTCTDCHEHHDNMPNWLSDPSAPSHQTHDAAFPGIPGINQKMIGRIDPDGLTPYAVILTREKDFDGNGEPDRGTVTQLCDDTIVNDCYTQERRYVVFEQATPATPLHAWAENTGVLEDPFNFLGAADPIVVRTNQSDSGATVGGNNWSAHDSLCGMCHTQTANHNLLTGGGLAHNDGRHCTDCHTHETCFDRSSCSPVPEQPDRDLQVDSVSALPASVSPGQTVTISVGATNLGDRFEAVEVRYSSDIEGFIGRSRIELDEFNTGGETGTTSFDWVTTAGGVHTITAQIEPQIFETVTGNNTGTDTVTVSTVHDVAVTAVTAPSPVLQGSPQIVSVDIANPGSFTETFNVTLVSDIDGTIGIQSSGALAPGGSTTLNFNWTNVALGTHTLTATAAHNPGDGGTDSNTGNDSANTTSDVIVPTHDVAVTGVTAPASTPQGNLAVVDVDVSNPGTFSETFDVTLVSDLDGTIGTQSSGALAPGGSTTLNFNWTTGAAGTHTLTATAAHDPVDSGTDSNVGNDSANTTADVTSGPVNDVAVLSVTASPNPVGPTSGPGDDVTFTVIVQNQGTVAETVDVSVASDLEGGEVCNINGVNLAAGATSTNEFVCIWRVKSNGNAGTHLMTATAATVPGETDTADNSATTTLVVN